MDQKGIAYLYILLGALVLVLVAGGAYYIGTRNVQPQQAINIPAVSQPTPTVAPTANWQTYTNAKYMYSFKYPQTWRISSPNDAGAVFITSRPTTKKAGGDFTPGVAGIGVSITSNTKATVIQNTLGVEKKSETTINGISATEIQGHSGVAGSVFFDSVLFEHNGNTYEFTLTTQDPDLIQPLTTEFHQILSTFTFTNQIQDTSNWNTYTSKTGNYSFNYPKDWQLTEKINPNLNKIIPVVSILPPGSFDTNPDYSGAGEDITIIVYNNPSNLKLEDFIKATVNNDQYTFNFVPITVANTNGEKLINLPGAFENENIYIAKGSNVYLIDWLKGQSKLPISEAQFNQIIATFKFTQ